MSASREQLKTVVRGLYDLQQLRVQTGNRITQIFKTRLGQEPSQPEEDLDAPEINILKELRKEFVRITDGIVANKLQFSETITSETEYRLVQQYIELLAFEKRGFKNLESMLEEFPIWNQWLVTVRGIGTQMAAVIIAEIDIHKCKYVSSVWKYCGLDVAPDGRGRGRYKEHLVERTYTDKEGVEKTKMGLTFSPWIKTKLIGVVGSGFCRLGGKYKLLYDQYKHRISTNKALRGHDGEPLTKMHIHNMAVRYAVKMFLQDLYAAWRKIEGLEVHPPYHEGVHGHIHNSGRARA